MAEHIDLDAFNATHFTAAEGNEMRLRVLAMSPGDTLTFAGVESTCTRAATETTAPTFCHYVLTPVDVVDITVTRDVQTAIVPSEFPGRPRPR